MCGIAGIFSLNQPIKKEWVESMTRQLAHRGPDAQGVFLSDNDRCGLGHRRLSILDLSEAANQPMKSPCGNYTLVFNGEIYNFETLREELKKSFQVDFTTDSDTEVVLMAFIHWGKTFVEKLNGMFAIAIYHHSSHQLYLYRDRMGIKPLYYYWKDGVFAFASELKSFTAIQSLLGKFTLNDRALHYFLRLGYIPEPHSIYKEVNKFPSGQRGRVDENGIEFNSYWLLNDQLLADTYKNEKEAKKKLNQILRESISKRLKSDVPFGVFLSGGIDSSTVASIAQDLHNQPIKTFSIGFKEASYNESEHAKAIANHLGTEHHEFTVSHQDAQELIPQLGEMFDEPFADASAIPTFLVSKLAREKVKMVLTGDGGDEQFLGYGMYQWADRLQSPFYRAFHHPMKWIFKSLPSSRFKRIADVLDYAPSTHMKSHIFSTEQYFFSEKELGSVFKGKSFYSLSFDELNKPRKLSSKEDQAYFDLHYYLKDDLLVKVDRASMKASLEARVPLLDHELVAFSVNLDEKLKVKGNDSKYLLKQVLFDYVPKEFFDRPKWGFGLPIRIWMSKELKWMLDEYLTSEKLEALHIDVEQVEKIKKRFLSGEDQLYNKLWLLMMLVQWHDKHKNFLNE